MAYSTETLENEFNKLFGTHFYVNPNKEVVIKNIQSRLILSEDEQAEIIKEIHNLTIKNLWEKNHQD